MNGSVQPYSRDGIRKTPCARCGKPSVHQWQICADKSIFRPTCRACDVALNEVVLKFFGFRNWRAKMKAYTAKDKP